MKRSEGEHATATINYAYPPTWDICSCKTPKEFSLGSLQLGEIFFFWILISCHVMPHLSIDCLSCSLLDCWAEQRRQIVKTCLLGTKSHYHWDGNSDHWPIALALSDVNRILVSVRHWFFSEVMQDLKVTLSGCLKKKCSLTNVVMIEYLLSVRILVLPLAVSCCVMFKSRKLGAKRWRVITNQTAHSSIYAHETVFRAVQFHTWNAVIAVQYHCPDILYIFSIMYTAHFS